MSAARKSRVLAGGRVLIAELDSQAQARMFPHSHRRDAGPGVRGAIESLTEVLRVGVAVAETVLLTDAMVLDGRYFLALGPDGLMRELGVATAHLPVVITGFDATLADALARRRATDAHAWAVAGGTLSKDWTPPAHIERAWQDWVDAAEAGFIRYERQRSGNAPMRFGEIDGLTPAARELCEALRNERLRSEVERILESQGGLTRADVGAVRGWWGDVYLRLIAENADASWISFAGSRAARIDERPGSVSLRLPRRLVMWARVSSPAEYAAGRAATDKARRKLQSGPSGLRLRSLAYVATASAVRPSRTRIMFESVGRIVVAACLILIALPFVPLVAADGPFAWVVFSVVVLGTFPIAAFGAVFEVLRREPTAIFVVHPSEVQG